MSVDVTANRTRARITQEKNEVACIFHTTCTPRSGHLSGSPGSPFHPWASWVTCTRKAVLWVLKNKPIILKPRVMREGKRKKTKPKTLAAEHPTSRSPPKLRQRQWGKGCWLKSQAWKSFLNEGSREWDSVTASPKAEAAWRKPAYLVGGKQIRTISIR